MSMNIYDLMYGLNDVSDYFVIETEKKSGQVRERLIIKWATLAASVCLVAAAVVYSVYMNGGFGHIMPADTVGWETTERETNERETDETTGAGETSDAADETTGDTDDTSDLNDETDGDGTNTPDDDYRYDHIHTSWSENEDKWKYIISDYESFIAEEWHWTGPNYDDRGWENGYMETENDYSPLWHAEDGEAIFLRTHFALTQEDIDKVESGELVIDLGISATYSRMMVYIGDMLVLDIDDKVNASQYGEHFELYPVCECYVYDGDLYEVLNTGDNNTIAVVILPLKVLGADCGDFTVNLTNYYSPREDGVHRH